MNQGRVSWPVSPAWFEMAYHGGTRLVGRLGIPTSETDEVGTSSTLDDVAKPNVPPGSGSSGKESESDIQSRSDLCDRNLEGASRVPGPVLEEDAELSYSETEAGSTSVPDDEVPEDQNMEPETVAPLPSPDPTEKQEDAAIEPGSEIAADQKATERNRDGNAEPTVRLKDKETLFMLLALHMEESPLCENPMGPKPARNEKNIMINKTGIVICDSDSIQRVVMMDCSREQLHAAQLVMMNLTTRAKSCDVYLSRKPCTDCAKCLVQDDPDRGVGAIIYNKRHSIIGVGYNGYIKKTTYGNFPRSGRNSNRTVSKSSSMVHAEVNALLFRSGKGTDSSVMFASKIPCSECEKMINASGIKIVVSVNDWKGTMEPRAGALELMEGAQESGEEVGSQEPGEGVKIILWEWPSELRGNQDNTDPPTMTHSCKLAVSVGPVRLPNKDDLLMYLALQMEDSPLCVEPKEKGKIKFSKTGITIFAGGGTNQILVIDCSRNGLHAVQQVLLSFPKCLQGNVVYLSRHPCVHCAKLLLQGVVGQVYYWPNLEQQEADDNEDALDNANKVNRLFRGAKVSAEMYIPLLDLETVVKRISPKIRLIPSTKPKVRTSIFDSTNLTKILEALQLLHIKKKDYKATFRKQMETAYKCLDALQNSTVGNFKKKSAGNPESQDGRNLHELSNSTDGNLEINNSSRDAEKEKRDLHALQLCFLLAARTDSPGPGVGALIYQDDCFVGIGYNGFPRGNRCGQYLQNYPELKEDGAQSQKKASGAQQQSRNFIICAEANALYFR
ncbi:uncharacterized protein LOC119955119 isoform X4 [Scyliorhinus canicula]|uniref:uncharacterized protein LOC119955119 isoform X4 n=1 Tax=Scyliorhinus canicula TaxID=7830 RepID=UPI0018F57768|nr:uncharacterized protein LOC119955119 isoform X4 [Scyliorhinus canicula]